MKLFTPKSLRSKFAAPNVIIPRGRMRTCDVAFQYRMGAGFAGDVNRIHPASIAPYLNDTVAPVQFFGQAVQTTASSNAVRGITTADNAITTGAFGVAVRPYPLQQFTTTGDFAAQGFGSVAPPPGAIDILKSGFILVPVVGAPKLGGTVYVWSAASGGGHVQGGFEAVNPAGSGFVLDNKSYFNGPADANGLVEIGFNL